MSDTLYSKTHEWIAKEDGKLRIGITDYAQQQLGDIVFVELPAVGDEIASGETMGTIESVKAVSDLYAPVSGNVVKINEELEGSPEIVNEDSAGKGWLIVVEPSNPEELSTLMDESTYDSFMSEEKEKEH